MGCLRSWLDKLTTNGIDDSAFASVSDPGQALSLSQGLFIVALQSMAALVLLPGPNGTGLLIADLAALLGPEGAALVGAFCADKDDLQIPGRSSAIRSGCRDFPPRYPFSWFCHGQYLNTAR